MNALVMHALRHTQERFFLPNHISIGSCSWAVPLGEGMAGSVRPGGTTLVRGKIDPHSRLTSEYEECQTVERDSQKVSGVWVFANTRVPLRALFENLEDGATVDQFVESLPEVTRQQVETVLEFAAASLELQASA